MLGSRSEERYREAAASFGGHRVHPFIADLAEPASLKSALDSLAQSEVRVTDVVHCAAGGLEPMLRPLIRAVAAVGRLPAGPERDRALDDHREELARLVASTASAAWKVNLEGPRELFARLIDSLPSGARLITYSSIWTTTVATGGCPAFYRATAESKAAFEAWLADQSPRWAAGGISATVVVMPLIGDTSMGKLIDRHIGPLLGDAAEQEWRTTYVSMAGVTGAVTRLLLEPFATESPLRRLFLTGPGELRDDLDPRVAAAVSQLPL